MSKKKRISSVIVAILLVALMSPFAFRAGLTETLGFSSGSFSSFSSYITFFNARDEFTALYVTKEVVNINPDFPAPEDEEFEFVLSKKTNGVTEVADGLDYYIRDAQGRIYNYDTGQTHTPDPNKFEIRTCTDDHGMFKLKAGQTAVFEGLSPGDNYIIEEIENEAYTTVVPAGATASVTLTAEGATVTFKNQYDGRPSGGDSTLQVRKRVSFPESYELPETPEFTFAVKIAGTAYSEKEYTIRDINTDDELGTGTTDDKGHFTLSGDTYAVFEHVPADVDYNVTEILSSDAEDQGWRVSGNTSEAGATEAGGITTANFTNVLASFVVSKEMFGGVSVDEAFQFQVVDKNGNPFGEELSYYLYDSTKTLVSEDLMKTGEDGTFTLRDGQRAVFTGLAKDTEYGVREIDSGRYVQYIPTTEAGYTDKIVMDSVEELPFTNATIPSKTLLTVKKQVSKEDPESSSAIPDVDFTFVITVIGEDGEETPVANAAYDIVTGSGTRTLEADENGEFTLKAWETARFTELDKGKTYKVTETDVPDRFVVAGAGSAEGELGDDPLQLTFKNVFTDEPPAVISVAKVNAKDEPLAGAQMQLILKDGDKETIVHEWVSQLVPTEITVKPNTTYYVREKAAPEGYEVAEDVEVTSGAGGSENMVTVSMTDHRDTTVPTGFNSPLVRILLVLLVLLAVAAVFYRGYYLRRRTA